MSGGHARKQADSPDVNLRSDQVGLRIKPLYTGSGFKTAVGDSGGGILQMSTLSEYRASCCEAALSALPLPGRCGLDCSAASSGGMISRPQGLRMRSCECSLPMLWRKFRSCGWRAAQGGVCQGGTGQAEETGKC